MSSSPGGWVEESAQHADAAFCLVTVEWLLQLVVFVILGKVR